MLDRLSSLLNVLVSEYHVFLIYEKKMSGVKTPCICTPKSRLFGLISICIFFNVEKWPCYRYFMRTRIVCVWVCTFACIKCSQHSVSLNDRVAPSITWTVFR